jgi:negative regulator of sigma-B (phosphoserine phosphatase)
MAWLSRPRDGEIENGDAVVVRQIGGNVVIALIDALGHGPRAAEVADSSVKFFGEAASGEGAPALVRGLHDRLQGSRGAAALILVISSAGLEACSVGNVELRSTSGKLPFVLTPGVLGIRLRQPKICASKGPLADRFVLFSDGISGRFDLKALRSHSPSTLATHIFATHRHAHDDATVVVVDVA